MENMKERRKIFNRISYLLFGFMLVVLLTISGLYNGVVAGIQLNQLVVVFGAVALAIVVYMGKLVLDEEKLEKQHTQ
ncbi:MAG: hypothetical protein V1835_05140 [Candidatus Micrarchaeota archaeon]